MINLESLQAAMNCLRGSGLRLWLYLTKNQMGYSFELSQKACANWGIKKDSYYTAIKELQDKGFLFQEHPNSNRFYFYERAQSQNPKAGFWFSAEDSENENPVSKNEKKDSEKAERNITNNTRQTKIIKNKTDFGYLEEKVLADGWLCDYDIYLDEGDLQFYERPMARQRVESQLRKYNFSDDEIDHIINEILDPFEDYTVEESRREIEKRMGF